MSFNVDNRIVIAIIVFFVKLNLSKINAIFFCKQGVKSLLHPEGKLPVREKELIPTRLSYFDRNDIQVSFQTKL